MVCVFLHLSLLAISKLPMLVRQLCFVTFGYLNHTNTIEIPFHQGSVLFFPLHHPYPSPTLMTQAPWVNITACGKDLFHSI